MSVQDTVAIVAMDISDDDNISVFTTNEEDFLNWANDLENQIILIMTKNIFRLLEISVPIRAILPDKSNNSFLHILSSEGKMYKVILK